MIRSFLSFSFHAVIISTAIAGIQRCSGYRLQLNSIGIPFLRLAFDRFLDLGDYCLNYAIEYAKTSDLFKKSIDNK